MGHHHDNAGKQRSEHKAFVGDADRRQGTEHYVAHKTAAECSQPAAQHNGEDVIALANGGKSAGQSPTQNSEVLDDHKNDVVLQRHLHEPLPSCAASVRFSPSSFCSHSSLSGATARRTRAYNRPCLTQLD